MLNKAIEKIEKQNIPAEFYRIIGFVKQIIFKSKIKAIMFVIFSKELESHAKREESGYFIFIPKLHPFS